jgi:anti-sigma regulatory factor (Ser/Thr protein kinase)
MTTRRRLEASDASVRAARRFVVGLIADAPTDVQESVSLMVSELATNALVHAASGFEVAVDRGDLAVLVSVRDRGDAGMPQLQEPESSEPHGRGLRVVDALSDEWGVTTTWDHGKTVWFRISLQSPTSDLPSSGNSDAAAFDRADQNDRSRATTGSTGTSLSDAPNSRGRGIDHLLRAKSGGSPRRHNRERPIRRMYPANRIGQTIQEESR